MKIDSLIRNGTVFFIILSFFIACSGDDAGVGSSLFDDSKKQVESFFIDVISFSEDHQDSIRTDRSYLPFVSIGAYDDSNFGETKASFYTQLRLSSLNPDFGTTPVIDSVELFIPVTADSGSPIFTDLVVDYGAGNSVRLDAFKINKNSIYGDSSVNMTLKVSEIKDPSFFFSVSDSITAKRVFTTGEELGTSVISNKVITKEFITNGISTFTETSGFRVKLNNNDFFKEKLFDKQGTADLQDQASFINLFKGIKIEVTESDGFIFNTNPSAFRMTVYYHNDTSTAEKFDFSFADANNVRFANYTNDSAPAISMANTTLGDETLYLQGLGGSRAIIKIDDAQLNAIKDSVQNKGWVINNTRFRFYVDAVNSPIDAEEYPLSLFLYVEDQADSVFQLLDDYFVENRGKDDRFRAGDITPAYDMNGLFYTVNLTEHIKNIVEEDLDADGNIKVNHDLVLSVGNLIGVTSSSGFYNRTDPYYQDRSYNPARIAIYGNREADLSKKLRLEIFYTKNE